MSLFGPPQVGDHVKARRDITSGLMDTLVDRPTIRKGKVGIVRGVDRSLFSDRLDVEFDDGLVTRVVRGVKAGEVSRTSSHGERAWSVRRDLQVGVRIGLFAAFGLPALVGLAIYFAGGGTLAELIPALFEEAVVFVFDVAAVIGPLGCLLVIGVLVLRAKLSRRRR